MFTLACIGDAWWAGVNNWMLSVQMLNHCWRAVVVHQSCCAIHTLHFVIFFFKCEMIPNFGHSLSFTDSFSALLHRAHSIVNVVVCVHNNSPCGKMTPEWSRPHNVIVINSVSSWNYFFLWWYSGSIQSWWRSDDLMILSLWKDTIETKTASFLSVPLCQLSRTAHAVPATPKYICSNESNWAHAASPVLSVCDQSGLKLWFTHSHVLLHQQLIRTVQLQLYVHLVSMKTIPWQPPLIWHCPFCSLLSISFL